MWRSFKLRLAVAILGGLLALFAILVAVVHTPPVRKYALRQVIQILGEQGVTFDANSLDYNLLKLSVSLDDVVMRSTQAPDLPPVARADRVWVDLSLRKILTGALYIQYGEVVNPAIHVVIDEQGRDNLPRPPEKEEEGETDYLIDEFRVAGGSLRFEDRRQQIAVSLPLSQIRVDGNPLTNNHEILLRTAEPGQVAFQQRTLPVRDLSADVLLEENAVNVRSASVGLGESTITLSGELQNFDDPRYDFNANTQLALGSLTQFAGVDQKVSGTVNLALTAQGPLSQLKATARLDGEDLTVDRFDNLDLKAEAAYDAQAQRVRLDSFNVLSPAGTIQGKGDIALNTAAGQSTLNASVRGLDLARVSTTLDLPVRIASRATADLAANWPALEFEKAAGDASVRLAATRETPAQDVLPLSGELNAKTSGDRVVVGIQSLETLDARATGQIVLVNRSRLGGEVRLEAPDLSDTVAKAEAFLGRQSGTLAGTNVDGSLTAEAKLAGTIENPAAAATISSPNLQAGTLDGITVNAAVDYNPSRLEIQNAAIEWRNQQITASGTVGMGGATQPLNVQAQAANVSIETVLAGLGRSDIPASGTVNFNAGIQGTTASPAAQVNLNATGLQAYQETLGTLTAQAEFANQLVTLSQLRLEKPQPGGNGTLQATGTYNVESKSYTVDLKSLNLQLTSLTLPDGSPVRGTVSLQAEGQGTVDNPALTAKASAEDLQYQEQQFGSLNLTANVANRQAKIKAEAPRFNLNASADVGIQDPYPATFEVTAKNTSLDSLPVKLDQPLEGNITATVRGSGDLKNYEAGQAKVEIAGLDLTWKGQPIRAEGPLVATYANRALTIEQATIVALESRLSVNGRLPLDESAGAGAIKIEGALDLETLLAYVPMEQTVEADGTVNIAGTITGTLKRIDPALTIGLENGYFYTAGLNPPLSNVTLQAEIRDGALQLEKLSAGWGVATLSATGEIPFALLPADLPVELPRRSGPAQFTAELNKLDLGTVEALPDNMGGLVSIRLEAQAPKPELEAITGKLTYPELQLSLGSFTFEQQGISTILLSNGTARIEQFHLAGPATDIRFAGTAGLTGARPLDLKLDGKLDAAIISAFTEGVRAQGATEIHVAVTGTAEDPKAKGYAELAGAQLSVPDPRVAAEGLNARVEFEGNEIILSRLSGTVNGGELSGGGSLVLADGQLRNTNLNIAAEGVFMDFPEGLRTLSNVKLALNSSGENLVVGGDVEIVEGGYTKDITLDPGAFAAFTSRDIDLTEERSPILERTRFNIGVRTLNPIVIDNNLAEAEITADLRVLGTPYEPGLSGRLTIEEGGELRLQEREYVVERGVVTFVGERRIEPVFDILASTEAAGYDIRLQITGPPGDTETILSSDPPLPEPDILAVLLTGRTMGELEGQELEVARNQVLSYLTGTVGSRLGRQIAGATGLSMVRIEPTLIANEANPGARLTIGQELARDLNLIYSMDLTNSSDQIYIAEYDLSRRFTTRGVRQSDGSFRMDFRHDVRFGGIPEPERQRRQRPVIGNVSILGNTYFPEEEIQKRLGAKPGKDYDFFNIRRGLDRITRMYMRENLLEAQVRLNRKPTNGSVDLAVQVERGPVVELVYEGISPDGDLQKRVREIWQSGVFDTQRAEDSVEAIRASLVDGNHLQPKIEYTISAPAPDRKRVLFDVQPGPEFEDVEIVFEGGSGIAPEELREIIKDQKLTTDVYVKPGNVTDLLTRYYREQGYLDASLEAPRYELDPQARTGKVVFPVTEGPLYQIADVEFQGNSVFDADRLARAVPLPIGETYRPVLRERAVQGVRELYFDQGYNDVEVESVVSRNKETGNVAVTLNIAEGLQGIVQEVVITGNRNTSDNLIRTQIELKPGDILNLQKLSDSRRNLYNTGAFSLIEIAREETKAEDGTAKQKPVRLAVRVREVQPFQIRYGGFFDTERGPGVIADFTNKNSLGSARSLGLRTRYDSQLQEVRLFFNQPILRRLPLTTTASPYLRRERNPETPEADPFNVDRLGFSLVQEARFKQKYLLNYGYRIERSRTYDVGPDAFFDIPLRIAALTSTFTRETRDDVLDATRGQFISNAFEWSPEALGSELRFVKYFGQYFRYFPLQDPKVELFTNEILRPRLVFASGVRAGLARGLGGQEIPLAERFFAGGSTTVRGFEQNSLGEFAGELLPLGGDAMLVINNELRFPLIGMFDGVGFVDLGNVYPRVSDFSVTNLRKAAGAGIRLRTPWFLLRLDYGIKLDRKPGESLGRLFFSIGQAF